VHIYNQDPTLAPPGKTTMIVMIPAQIDYWRNLANDRNSYKKKKKQIGDTIVRALEQRFPGISKQVEMIDVATPLTWERYTGNWKGSFEGWLPTPQNMMTPMIKTLPGLANFYMVGQWVHPGGGLPPCVMHGREIIQLLCQLDKKEFTTTVA
jgi:phytoene dehydrogenase-like protein